MAYGRNTSAHGTWFQEQQNLINSASADEIETLNSAFDENFRRTANTISNTYGGVNIMKDAKKMMDSPEIMKEYKELMLQPIVNEFMEMAQTVTTEAERVHLESVADQLDKAWDESVKSFMIQESYNTSTYLPLSTMDFPALIKQYIRFLGKDIIPVQTTSSVNIEQRIFTKYLVNNQTGEEYETPAIYYKKDEDGKLLWKKLYNAGKGIRINNKDVLTLETIQAATNKKYSVFNWLLDDDGNATTITPNIRTRLSYDFGIQYVQVEVEETTPGATDQDEPVTTTGTYKVKLPGNGIDIDIQTGGMFINGGITEDMKLPVVDEDTNKPTGQVVSISDRLSGVVDFVKGTITASSCGVITGIYLEGRISNETNLRTIGFREYPSIRKFLISDGCRFQLAFTVEDFAEANASLNFSLYNRLAQELVTNQELFEDESILEELDRVHDMYDGYDSDVFALDSYTHTEYADFDPTTTTNAYAGSIYEYRSDALYNAIRSTIYELCDKGKLDNLGFVIYANPKCASLLKKYTSWTCQKNTEIGGVVMNQAFGVLTDTETPIRVVASSRVDAYTLIPAYQDGAEEGDMSKEYFFKIIGYPMDKLHISFKHLRFARHLTNSPENAAYADANNAGGAAALITTSAQYKTIHIQGITGRVICKNSALTPDSQAGLVVTTTVTD